MQNKLVRVTLIITGTFFVAIGVLGIFLPLLPTTPFLLIAAALYARSSERFYYWLLHNRWFGGYIKNYREGKGISRKVKIWTISLLWITIIFSICTVEIVLVRILLFLIAAAVSIHIISIRTIRQKKRNRQYD
ncbi:MAG: hypothetical protein A2163_04780 [Actinobacteria bacterium RBG_13_35_12]|uniref:DUF454 domain-containing protein n=1 Tax=Candidatus Sediminicultor quintus TaxID=1797291 RepID=A0A1F5AAW2_9BACT|nr:MAG: hypothetical protein A2163_04780 [Actinobacteria bacterium RBG_13_35_12]OGD15625.1 MAG: hypothetical protein A2V47_05035 [Candidatus Atribacteria bacterium RBG_19FT_COMBO_35_14]